MIQIEIDSGSGFCFGVTTAISKAEEELSRSDTLYCLGDIVHNGMEVERLHLQGLQTIDHSQLSQLHDVKVLLRAHGEPPATYATAERNHIEIIDATCPVVLQLQRRIKRQYDDNPQAQIVIFGKNGASHLCFDRDIYLYSQTTKSLDEFHALIAYIQAHISPQATFRSFDTICRQVANRMPNIAAFAARHDMILFVSGHKSSNGKVLFNECLRVNANSHHIEQPSEIDLHWLDGVKTIGICGATSTPKWIMEQCRDHILEALKR